MGTTIGSHARNPWERSRGPSSTAGWVTADAHPQSLIASFLGFRAWDPMVVPIPPELSTTCQHRTVDDRVVTQYILWSFHAPTTRRSEERRVGREDKTGGP